MAPAADEEQPATEAAMDLDEVHSIGEEEVDSSDTQELSIPDAGLIVDIDIDDADELIGLPEAEEGDGPATELLGGDGAVVEGAERTKTVNVKRAWTEVEDKLLIETVEKYGAQRWSLIASNMTGRVGKQCRERWFNHLCPAVKKGEWTPEEARAALPPPNAHQGGARPPSHAQRPARAGPPDRAGRGGAWDAVVRDRQAAPRSHRQRDQEPLQLEPTAPPAHGAPRAGG